MTNNCQGWTAAPNWVMRAEAAEIPAGSKLLYTILASFAGRKGVAWPSMAELRSLTGYTDNTIRKYLRKLEDLGLLTVTTRYIPGTRERTSNLYRLEFVEKLSTDVPQPLREGTSPREGGTSTIEGGYLNKRTEVPQPLSREEDTRRIINEEHVQPSVEPTPKPVENSEGKENELFDAFWAAYPRRAKKSAARTLFAAALADGIDPQTIIDGARHYATDPNLPEKRFIPLPTTWLKDRGWEDEPEPARPKSASAIEAEEVERQRRVRNLQRACGGLLNTVPMPPNLGEVTVNRQRAYERAFRACGAQTGNKEKAWLAGCKAAGLNPKAFPL
ncbi:helix-turn-helix domain-containing protein [Arcanobacterium canis]